MSTQRKPEVGTGSLRKNSKLKDVTETAVLDCSLVENKMLAECILLQMC